MTVKAPDYVPRDWEFPPKHRDDYPELYEQAEARADKRQDFLDGIVWLCVLSVVVFFMGLGITKAVELLAGWIA